MSNKRKTVTALAAVAMTAGISTHAIAADNVTIYGVMDTFLTDIRPEGSGSTLRLDSSGLLASRLGFRGSEDLGGGYKTNFTLEAGLNANDGTGADANRLFNRQAWVGISGPFGEFRLGRQNTPQFFMNGEFDAFNGATQASGWNNMFGAVPRVDNAIGYISPVMGGVKLQALIGRGAGPGGPALPEIVDNQNVHLGAEYRNGPFYAGVNYETIGNTTTAKARRTGLGASYKFNGAWAVFGAADKETNDSSTVDTNLYSVSARYAFDPASSLAFGYATTRDKLSGTGHGDANELSALYRYFLSKRTTLYAAASRINQKDLRNSFTLAGAAVTEAGSRPAATPGGSINGVQLGITHTF